MTYRTQLLLLVSVVAIGCAAGVHLATYRGARALLVDALEDQVKSLAVTAAASVDATLHEAAVRSGDGESESYRVIAQRLRELRTIWRDSGVEVRFVYTIVRDPRSPSGFAYGVDAEEAGPARSELGEAVSGSGGRFGDGASNPRAPTAAMTSDEFGEVLTGIAPIMREDGTIVAFAGVDIPMSSVRSLEWTLLLTSGLAAAVVLLLALLAAGFMVRRIVGPIERLRRSAEMIAGGDLSSESLPSGAREVQVLSSAFESLRGTLRTIVARVQEASVCANETCFTLGEQAVAERNRARTAAADAVEAAGRAGQIATTARTLADAAEDLRAAGAGVVEAGSEGIENLRALAGDVENLRQTGQALSTQLETLRERARAVDSLLEAMVSVADRSNLLSLNAEIEASKAGEAGRGFMVVAAEIRRLAEQAAASSLQIEGNVRRMHEAVDAGVESTKQLAQSLSQSALRAQHGTDLLNASVQGIEAIGPRVAGIADASVAQRQGAEAISKSMGELAEAATNALSFFEAVEGMVSDIRRRGGEMAAEVQRFRL